MMNPDSILRPFHLIRPNVIRAEIIGRIKDNVPYMLYTITFVWNTQTLFFQ